jgi:hypothetical protein
MCALALCPPVIQSPLQTFVHVRYLRYASNYASSSHAAEITAPSHDACESWHWFESYFQLHQNRQGKSYKDWLFARTSSGKSTPDSGDIESGVSSLLRDVVRDRLRKETSPRRVTSLDAGSCSATDGPAISLLELLPDEFNTNNEVEHREITRIAASLADSILDSLSRRERLALLGRKIGLSLTNSLLLKAANCRKSVLAEAHRSALTTVAHNIALAYPDETRPTQASLAVAVFYLIQNAIILWAKAENELSEFLSALTIGNRYKKQELNHG